MAEESAQERTERATAKKRQESRKKGRVCQSREVSSVSILILAVAYFFFFGNAMFASVRQLVSSLLTMSGTFELSERTLPVLIMHCASSLSTFLLPFILLLVIVAVFSNTAQFGWNFAPEAIRLDFGKLNVVNGMKRFFRLESLVELLKAVAKISIVGYVAYLTIKGQSHRFLMAMHMDPLDIIKFMGYLSFLILLKCTVILIFLAAADWVFQKYSYEKSLKMTKQEIKDEHKEHEGDPKIKARVRKIQMELATRRMMESVPLADVVLTNPTEIAVAMRYDAHNMPAPVVVAKGRGHVAEKIRGLAIKHGVPVLERRELARELFRLVRIGDVIPANLYQAVAEVLAFIYRLKGKVA